MEDGNEHLVVTRRIRNCFLWTVPVVLAPLVCAAAPPMVFEHLTLQDGLSQSAVMDVHQDSQGFVWLATENGLNRYDGYEVRRYVQERHGLTGLRSDFIWVIEEDADGDLWLGTEAGGVARWDRQSDSFVSYLHDPDNPNTLSSNAVRTLLIENDRAIWVGTRGGGLNLLDPVTGLVTRYDSRVVGAEIFTIHADGRNAIWLGTEAGLRRFDPSTGTGTHYRHDPEDPHSLSDDKVRTIYPDSAGALWVGTSRGGLNRFDRSSGRFRHFRRDPGDETSLSHDEVRAILEDDRGRLWIGTADGLNILHRETGTFSRYHRDQADSTSLSNSYVMALYQDRSGLLWVGTRGGGVSRWNPRSWSLGHYVPDLLKGSQVTSFADDGAGRLWVGTLGAGLLHIEFFANGEHLEAVTGLSDERVMSLLYDRQGTLWVGTMTRGLNRVDPESGRVETFRADPADPESLSADGIMSLYEDRAGNLWVGTYGGGINRFDRSSGSFQRFSHDPDDPTTALSNARATALVEDQDGNLWIGTDGGGLNVLDPASGKFRHFRYDAARSDSLSSDIVYSLHRDLQGTLWIGTAGGGLDRLVGLPTSEAAARFVNYSQETGLSSNVVYGIRSDLRGRLWLSINNGLMRFDPASGAVRVFHRNHGLQGEDFNFGAHYAGADGRLYFGGSNGFNAFNPLRVEESEISPPLVLTAFEKYNRPAATQVPHPLIDSLRLGYQDDVVTFEFAALDYTAPHENRYSYRLAGFEDDWVDAGNRRRVTYTNLRAGNYTFEVSAANSDGVWTHRGLAIPVGVAPAPWQTIPAYITYAALFVAFIATLLRWQRRKLEREAEMRRLAYYDQLTGLGNYKLFKDLVNEGLYEADRLGEELALLYLDLDNFKRINDTLGHSVGDRIIRAVASRISKTVAGQVDALGRRDLARFGGDEFVIFVRGPAAGARAAGLSEQLIAAVSEPFDVDGQELFVTASVGISVFPAHARDVEGLLKNADTAVREAKAAGRRIVKVFADGMNASSLERLSLEGELRQALRDDRLQLYFQPKVDAERLRIVGAEALLRWFHPERGEISPEVFVPLAEEAGLATELGRWVAEAVCRQIKSWRSFGRLVVPISMNLSGREFTQGDPVSSLTQVTQSAGVAPALLELEITESILLQDVDGVTRALQSLKALGFGLALDDFGTGYSSLAYLKRFPLDVIKIDRSFVRDIQTNTDSVAICSAIIAMGHSLGLRVVAEGVDNEVQLNWLVAAGCNELQGFFLGRPVPAETLAAHIARQSRSDWAPAIALARAAGD